MPVSRLREELMAIVHQRGLMRHDPPIQLASGDVSSHFIDIKLALASGANLRLASQAVLEVVGEMGVEFDAVGGLTMGADQIAHGVAMLSDAEWFSVRKQTKERGTRKRIEGAALHAGKRVLLVDDVVTRGGSIADALEAIRETDATVVAALSLVDRGTFAAQFFKDQRIPYQPLITFADLNIEPVGDESRITSATG
ncbi:MAG: orotate phosphoribosyltransferase [Actinomycetota bacterium]|jgi:orotate phosphoribosyltransferase|nr:orotate phosphoribosyltransferase [Actinomycetota bacterium]